MSDQHCPCDEWRHPAELCIHAGLDHIPRQIAGFAEFRRALLAEIQKHPPLAAWRVRSADDLGVMLLEMWAYVCDVLAFYDEVIANEAYVRTAQLRPSVRKLVNLLGYVPHPAVAASVLLAAIAEGRQPLSLPAGTAFRSQAFDAEPPQIFELDHETTIHALNNQWTISPVRAKTIGVEGHDSSQLLLKPASTLLKKDDVVLLRIPQLEHTCVGTVRSVERVREQAGAPYDRVEFSPSVTIPGEALPEQIQLWRPSQTASLWNMERVDPDDPQAIEIFGAAGTIGSWSLDVEVVLDSLYRQIKPEQYLVLQGGGDFQWFRVKRIAETLMHVQPARTIQVPDENGEMRSVAVPPITTPATRLSLSTHSKHGLPAFPWDDEDRGRIIVHYGFVEAGQVTVEADSTVTADVPLSLEPTRTGRLELLAETDLPQRFLVEDRNGVGHEVGGTIDPGWQSLNLDPDAGWSSPLLRPVKVFGNVLRASRGETVACEVLGSGDASIAGQSFKLKKKPLTYTFAPTLDDERGVMSTLTVRVDGIAWKEVSSFFGVGADEGVYIVRQTDDGETLITFGDGRWGRRLPTGQNNVSASYRFGAGAKAPPAGALTQLARPVKGLTSVHNPLPASGGDNAEGADKLRSHAPRSALILGRAVSVDDFQAVAAGLPGVRAVRAEWRWDGTRQTAVVKLWYVGEPGIVAKVRKQLRQLADPTVAIDVEPAQPQPLRLIFAIEIDPRHDEDVVLTAVRLELMNPATGLLVPERIGIGRPLFRSRLFESVLAVPGTLAVTDIQYDRSPFAGAVSFADIGLKQDAGRYFDLEAGALVLNGREDFPGGLR